MPVSSISAILGLTTVGSRKMTGKRHASRTTTVLESFPASATPTDDRSIEAFAWNPSQIAAKMAETTAPRESAAMDSIVVLKGILTN